MLSFLTVLNTPTWPSFLPILCVLTSPGAWVEAWRTVLMGVEVLRGIAGLTNWAVYWASVEFRPITAKQWEKFKRFRFRDGIDQNQA